jgi:hypothetical protein
VDDLYFTNESFEQKFIPNCWVNSGRVSWRESCPYTCHSGIAPLSWDYTAEVNGQLHALAALPQKGTLVPTEEEAGSAPESVWMFWWSKKFLAPVRKWVLGQATYFLIFELFYFGICCKFRCRMWALSDICWSSIMGNISLNLRVIFSSRPGIVSSEDL